MALLLFGVVWVIIRLLFSLISRKFRVLAQKTETTLDDLVADLFQKVKFYVLFVVSVYIGSLLLTLPPVVEKVLGEVLVIALLIQGGIWGSVVIEYWINRYKKDKMEEDAATVTTFTALGFIGRIALWTVVLLLALDNLGVEVSALIAGLGIGGVAVALALQNVLGDLFASLSIVLDKPFVIGDFIIVDNYLGTIEHVGLKTTRVRSLSGEQLIFANSDLLKSRIRNYKRMVERRIVFTLGVTYQTPYEKLKKIPQIIKEVLEKQENARLDRAHFKEYGDFSLNYEIVYYVQSPDYYLYMDIQQAVNLEIYRRFQEEGIEFAYPTQTLFLRRENNNG
ncbi:mechanosensitive ion channel family protein [bacterium]|nr:mechanosensitive ion channel family protein [bacterium]